MRIHVCMRMNVYVPEALSKRMKAVRGEINWSEVAQQAFEQKLGELAATKLIPDMTDTIDRLRASRAKTTNNKTAAGREAGEAWAKSHAEYDQLERLASFYVRAVEIGHSRGMANSHITSPELLLGSQRTKWTENN